MKLELINDLNESSQYRTRQHLRRSSARHFANHAFVDMLTLWILYNEFNFAPVAMKYADKTSVYGNFRNYRQSGTDLYVTLHVLTAKNADLIDGDARDQALLNKIQLDDKRLKMYFDLMSLNQLSPAYARQTLQDLEKRLFIDNSGYRSSRRLAQDWMNLNDTQRALVVTRLLQFYRTHARRSELFGFLEDLARTKKLEIQNANNAEVPQSKSLGTIAKAAALGAAGYAGFHAGRALGRSLV
jgi:hypothetical protein